MVRLLILNKPSESAGHYTFHRKVQQAPCASQPLVCYNIACRGGGVPAQVPSQRLKKLGASGHSLKGSIIPPAGAPISLCHIYPGTLFYDASKIVQCPRLCSDASISTRCSQQPRVRPAPPSTVKSNESCEVLCLVAAKKAHLLVK